MCRPPRHETHALPLERRRRRTSSCSNVHLVPVDTPTLSARQRAPARGERKRVRGGDAIVGTTIVPAQREYRDPRRRSALLHLVDSYERIIVCAPSESFFLPLPLPSSCHSAPLSVRFLFLPRARSSSMFVDRVLRSIFPQGMIDINIKYPVRKSF